MRYLLQHALEEVATQRPNALAVVDRGRTLTYGELDGESNRIANLLADLGVTRGDRVGLYLDKSVESVVAVYGIMKTGAAYVPFDADAPIHRLAYIAANCGISVVVTGEEKRDRWAALIDHGAPLEKFVVLNADGVDGAVSGALIVGRAILEGFGTDRRSFEGIDQDLAYILYTSGSTGDPKGVMLTHRNAVAFVQWAADEFAVGPADRLSSHAPLHFDLSVFDLFAAAWGGAPVVLVPAKTSVFPSQIVRFIRDNEITVWYSVPSILIMLTLRGGLSEGDIPSLRTVLFAGEVFPTKYLRQLMNLVPGARFANLYGPTETNVCTWYEVGHLAEDDQPIPIGRAIPNDQVFAVTDNGALAGIGEQGELHVRGATVMRGYWGDPERTARSLIPDPTGGTHDDPVYRTGDLVEVMAQGGFRYLGRKDSQIKSRGYRIELGDVEVAINRHPGVVECAVVAVPDDLVTNRVVAHVVARDGVDEQDLARFCLDLLPRYMVPERFELRAALPKTSTGKIDRRKLAASSVKTSP